MTFLSLFSCDTLMKNDLNISIFLEILDIDMNITILYTALMIAAHLGDLEMVDLLIEAGANIGLISYHTRMISDLSLTLLHSTPISMFLLFYTILRFSCVVVNTIITNTTISPPPTSSSFRFLFHIPATEQHM